MAEEERVEDTVTCEPQKVASPSAVAVPPLVAWPRGMVNQEGPDVLLARMTQHILS